MFALPWFSSFGHTLLWITGFKPGLAFKLLNSSVDQDDLSDEQLERLAPPIVDLARMTQGRRVNGETGGDVDAAIQTLREAMEALVDNGDLVRMTTARMVVEILSPVQAVRFLALLLLSFRSTFVCGVGREKPLEEEEEEELLAC
ncbi:hypothetical protein BVC80_9093g59 [Macleaya cordata]|uniref:DOG1 domain-containing protein n=1 Tax=Macleaya cordata TaxID=56857 RepID=A0A200PX00_MACCD|nr:hypothetical protein BVC80_9093g59 [Macleaya cordata]